MKRSRRFGSIVTARKFKNAVNGVIVDISKHPESKSNYKVIYTKDDAKRGMANKV